MPAAERWYDNHIDYQHYYNAAYQLHDHGYDYDMSGLHAQHSGQHHHDHDPHDVDHHRQFDPYDFRAAHDDLHRVGYDHLYDCPRYDDELDLADYHRALDYVDQLDPADDP
jgi:hypothetical protein